MKKRTITIIIVIIFIFSFASGVMAFDRNSITSGARVTGGINNSYNIVNTIILSPPSVVGQNAANLPAYQQILAIMSQIEKLKQRLKR